MRVEMRKKVWWETGYLFTLGWGQMQGAETGGKEVCVGG